MEKNNSNEYLFENYQKKFIRGEKPYIPHINKNNNHSSLHKNSSIDELVINKLYETFNQKLYNSLSSLNSANLLFHIYQKGKIKEQNYQEDILENILKIKKLNQYRINYKLKKISNNNQIKKSNSCSYIKLNSLKNKNKNKNKSKMANLILVPKKDLGKYKKITYFRNTSSKGRLLVKKPRARSAMKYDDILKIFSHKYEKDKQNFNNILFDECIDMRKKKFPLESFIKGFSNKNFIENLYNAKNML